MKKKDEAAVKRHTASEVAFAFFALTVMMIACGADTYSNAQKGAWGWFWFSLASTVFFAAVLGWLGIDAFNRYQRRRSAARQAGAHLE